MNERENGIETLRSALIEGEGSGVSTPFDFDAFVAGKRKAHQRGGKGGSRAETKTK